MSDLVDWMHAQVDADAAAADIISAGGYEPQTWHAEHPGPGSVPVGILVFAEDRCIGDPPGYVERAEAPLAVVMDNRGEYAHIARWDPARVMALMQALRTILDSFSWEAQETRAIQVLGEALYADRPGYREEWRP